jgi:aspartate/methionine/tyrosine aminotransferase
MGWVVADADLAAQVAKLHAALLNPASGPAQQALTELPRVPGDYLERAKAAVGKRLDELSAAVRSTGLACRRPAGGFYLWLDVGELSDGDGTQAFCLDLARRCGVGLWPGEDFGGGGHVRIAATAPSEDVWESSLAALVKALAR